MKYYFIKKNEKLFPIEKMSLVLEISTGSFIVGKEQVLQLLKKRVIALKEQLKNVFFESKQRYESPRPESYAQTGEVIY